jgi:hypothetical protein
VRKSNTDKGGDQRRGGCGGGGGAQCACAVQRYSPLRSGYSPPRTAVESRRSRRWTPAHPLSSELNSLDRSALSVPFCVRRRRLGYGGLQRGNHQHTRCRDETTEAYIRRGRMRQKRRQRDDDRWLLQAKSSGEALVIIDIECTDSAVGIRSRLPRIVRRLEMLRDFRRSTRFVSRLTFVVPVYRPRPFVGKARDV